MPSSNYDEDLSQNPFFQIFLQNYLDLFSKCVLEKWLICVPKKDSLPKHGFTIEDFTHHILKPLNHFQELIPIGGNNDNLNVSGSAGDVVEICSAASTTSGPDAHSGGGPITSRRRRSSDGGESDSNSSRSSAASNSSTTFQKLNNISPTNTRKWNFHTLSGTKIAYDYNTLFLDQSQEFPESVVLDEPPPPPPGSGSVIPRAYAHHAQRARAQQQQHPAPPPKIIRVLFEETFYTSDKQKYKVLCVASPLNSKVTGRDEVTATTGKDDDGANDVEDGSLSGAASPGRRPDRNNDSVDWTLTSLRDCIDFIWLNGKRGSLETYDGQIKLFLHNHKTLDDLPLTAQRRLVADLYAKCLAAGCKPKRKRREEKQSQIVKGGRDNENEAERDKDPNTGLSEEGPTAVDDEQLPDPDSLLEQQRALQEEENDAKLASNFKLATETYILHGLFRYLIHALSSALSVEDANLNKILRNLADLQPKDLGIQQGHWENLGRAKLELGKFANLSSPLAKLDCLRRTMNQLKCESQGNEESPASGPAPPPLLLTADSLLPIWAYLVIKTPIGNWMAQLEFLKEYRLSGVDPPGGENSFLVATLEATVTHLYSERVSFCCYGDTGDLFQNGGENGNGFSVEDDDNEGPLLTGWLPASFDWDDDDDQDEDDDESIIEMLLAIKQGNLLQLEHLIEQYELRRKNELRALTNLLDGVDESKLCHPLCSCEYCTELLRPPREEVDLKAATELQTGAAGISLLHMACICGRPKIVEFLLSLGASASVKDKLQMTPLHYAAARGHQNALLLLCHSGAPLDELDHMSNTPLHYAALNGHESCVKALIYYAEHSRKPFNLSCQNFNGDTPLHFASRYGYQPIVQILVENGASITICNARQSSPADCAHNIHITRILQRSLRRRNFCNSTKHGDFINIDMLPKETSPGVFMLISEPKEEQEQEKPSTDKEATELITNQITPTIKIEDTATAEQSKLEQSLTTSLSASTTVPSVSLISSGSGRRRNSEGLISGISGLGGGGGGGSAGGRRVRKISYNLGSNPPGLSLLDNIEEGKPSGLGSRRNSIQQLMSGQPMKINNQNSSSNSLLFPNLRNLGFNFASHGMAGMLPLKSKSFDFIEDELKLKDKRRSWGSRSPKFLSAGAGAGSGSGSDDDENDDPENGGGFRVLNSPPPTTFEPEHLRTISVDNLEYAPSILANMTSSTGSSAEMKKKRKEIGVRKLFNAIAIGDVPLALYYLGIPTDELENDEENIVPGELVNLNSCHPLCSCSRCLAKTTSLGLDINIKNLEGVCPLHLAVMYNLHVLVKILLKYHADFNLKTSFERKTAADIARDMHFEEIWETLENWKLAAASTAASSLTNQSSKN